MSEFKRYHRKQIAELRPYVDGESHGGFSISTEDVKAGSPKLGDMIARNPKNHADQWLVAAAYFADNFEALAAAEASAQGEAGRLSESEAVTLLTEAMRVADRAFERAGGSTRHHVRDCLIPELERMGLAVVKSARLEPAARWVDLTERMPPIGATVIVLRHGESEPIAAQLDDDGDWVDAATHEIRRVTHWMPLPPPPKVEPK